MTTQTPATPEELEQARDDREFPEDLDWNAEYTVLAEQNDGRLSHRKDDWLYALTHQYAGEEAIINGEAERYIHDTLSPGIHVAYSFDPVLRNGTLTVLITMHPAVLDHHKDPNAIGDETMATAQVQVLFQSERTAALVRAALEEQDEEEETPDAPPAGDGEQLPEGLDWSARYTVLVNPDDRRANAIDWRAALTDGDGTPAGALTGEHTAAVEHAGATAAFRFGFSTDRHGGPAAYASLHPATGPDMEPDLDNIIAEAIIIMHHDDPRTTEAVSRYIRKNHD